MDRLCDPRQQFQFLSQLVLPASSQTSATRLSAIAHNLNRGAVEPVAALAAKNHVIVRAFSSLTELLRSASTETKEWVSRAAEQEGARIHHALDFLDRICATLEKEGCPVTVIKSLDHWPDLGSDLDLFTDAEPSHIVNVLRTKLDAKIDDRSWGDRLANKWNFVVPGLPELVEVHIRRLGQTGEQTVLTKSLLQRTRIANIGQYSFRVLAPEDRIIISTLQRMYRHFYIRLCDVIDNAGLLESGHVHFTRLHSLGCAAGIWEGIASYLRIISGYVEEFCGLGIALPTLVTASAKFGVEQVYYRRNFLRVPILPHSLNLYGGELRELVMRGDVRNSLRLSLLPGLAAAAALELKLTGSDKGIW